MSCNELGAPWLLHTYVSLFWTEYFCWQVIFLNWTQTAAYCAVIWLFYVYFSASGCRLLSYQKKRLEKTCCTHVPEYNVEKKLNFTKRNLLQKYANSSRFLDTCSLLDWCIPDFSSVNLWKCFRVLWKPLN